MKVLRNLEGWIRAYRAYFNPRDWVRYRRLCGRHRLQQDWSAGLPGAIAVFDLKSELIERDRGRYAYLLITYFREAGYAIVLKDNYRFLVNLRSKQYKRLLLAQPFHIVSRYDEVRAPYTAVRDHDGEGVDDRCERVVRVRYDSSMVLGPDGLALPYGMHPLQYALGAHRRLDSLRRSRRVWRIFFAGNTDPRKYGRDTLSRVYGKLSRTQIIDRVQRALPSDGLRVVTDLAGLEAGAEDHYFDGVVLVDYDRARIEPSSWLDTIARADCFLACPGAAAPMCHNIIEAMAVGTIPLTEYPEYFEPPLRPGVTCISFEGAEDLERQIEVVRQLDRDQIRRLRANVVAYYEDHLSIAGVFEKLGALQAKEVQLFVSAQEGPRGSAAPGAH